MSRSLSGSAPSTWLTSPDATYRDLGADYHAGRINVERKIRNHVRQLEAFGLQVTLTEAAA